MVFVLCPCYAQQLMSDDTLGLIERLEAAGVVQPSEQARVLEALALVDEGGVTAEAVAGLNRARELLTPTGLTIEGLHKAGCVVPSALTEALEAAGMSDTEERSRLVQALAHATASGVTADAVASGRPMVPAEAQWELVPVPKSWGVMSDASAAASPDSSDLLPPTLQVELEGDAVVIGRGSVSAGIHKVHRHISRRHAEIVAERGTPHACATRLSPRFLILRGKCQTGTKPSAISNASSVAICVVQRSCGSKADSGVHASRFRWLCRTRGDGCQLHTQHCRTSCG